MAVFHRDEKNNERGKYGRGFAVIKRRSDGGVLNEDLIVEFGSAVRSYLATVPIRRTADIEGFEKVFNFYSNILITHCPYNSNKIVSVLKPGNTGITCYLSEFRMSGGGR